MSAGLIIFLVLSSVFSTALGAALSHGNNSALQEDAQAFNSEEAQKAREWALSPEHMQQAEALGVNPDLFISSLLGGNMNTPMASSNVGSSPSMAGAMSSLFNGMGVNIPQLMKLGGEMTGQDLTNQGKVIENYWTPLMNEQKIVMWDAHTQEFCAQAGLDEALTNMYNEQARWIEPMSQSQIKELNAQWFNLMNQGIKAFSEAETQESLQNFYNTQATENLSQARVNNANAEWQENYYNNNYHLWSSILNDKVDEESYKKMDAYWNYYLRNAMGGLPLSDDMKEMLWMMKASGDEELGKTADSIWNSFLDGSADMYDREVQNSWENYWKNLLIQFQGVVPSAAEGFGQGAGFRLGAGAAAGKGKAGAASKGAAAAANGASAVGVGRAPFSSKYPKGSPEWQQDYFRYVSQGIQ